MADEQETDESIQLSADPATAFSELMDFMVADAAEGEGAEGGEAADAATAGDGSPAAPAEGTESAEGTAGAPAAGDAGGEGLPAGDPNAPGATGTPASGANAGSGESAYAAGTGFDASELAPKWGELITGLEKRQNEELTETAVSEIREEYKNYIAAIEQHPRALIGRQVPSATDPEKMETLRDSNDAKDWQDAIRQTLGQEVRDRVSRKADDSRGMMETLHNSINLFQNNPDILPGAKQFDKELADRFMETVSPYILKVEDNFVGFTIPVQPLLTQLRQQLTATRSAAKPAPAPSAQQQRAANQPRNERQQFASDGPQEGIPSKAGGGGEQSEDFSTLFGTIGLPDFRI